MKRKTGKGRHNFFTALKKDAESGITLVALVVTIIILLILATVSINVSVNYVGEMKMQSFYTKLEIAQRGVEKIANTNENYIHENGQTIYLKDLGQEPTQEQLELIDNLGYSNYNFRYFTSEEVESSLEISGVELNLLINFDEQLVINPEGIEVNGQKYYTLNSDKYTVTKNQDKNVGNVDFEYTVEKYGSDSYRIKIEPFNIGDINKGLVQYKDIDVSYWQVANNNEFIIKKLGQYDVKYEDANKNTITKRLEVSLDNDGNAIINEVE